VRRIISKVADDWYRDPGWDAADRDEFERRLSRARPHNRQQYLKLKAIALRDAGLIDAARSLLIRAVDYPEPDLAVERAHSRELLGNIAVQTGDVEEALHQYRTVIQENPTLNGTSGSIRIAAAEVLLTRKGPGDVEEAIAHLDSWPAEVGFQLSSEIFRWHLARISAATIKRDVDAVRESARAALQLVEAPPQFRFHPTVGLVHTDRKTLRQLRRWAR
jgi:tetratricopeptide (TPR) repeat protein